jgi:predicted Zn-dependent protease
LDIRNPTLLAVVRASQSYDWPGAQVHVEQLRMAAKPLPRGDRKTARALNADGIRLLQSRVYDQAVSVLERSVQADPSDVEVRNNLAYAYMLAGRYPAANRTLQALLAEVPDRSSAWANLAELYSRAGMEEVAVASLQLAVFHSANRQKTMDYLAGVSTTHEVVQFQRVADAVLRNMDRVPTLSESGKSR